MKMSTVLSTLAAAAVLAISTSARADLYPDFRVDPTVFGGPLAGTSAFTADKINGNYVEVITFNNVTPTSGTFAFSLYFQAGQFESNDGVNVVPTTTSGLGVNYGLYATYQGTGTFSSSGATSQFALNPGGSLNVFVDHPLNNNNLSITPPAVGGGAFNIPGSGDDTKIATGAGTFGSGNLSCTGGNNCGSFGQTTTFNLTTPAGTNYFIQPVPFYQLSMQSGQFNGFTPAGTLTLNGSMDVIFAAVPEPSTLALAGIALVGLGAAARRRRS